MPIVSTPAIIVRRVDHSESSLICTFYTRNHGMLSAIAKGARRQSSQFAGLLDLMSYLDIVVYVKESRSVQTLSSAEYITPFTRLQNDIDRSMLGMIVIETIRQAIIGEEPHPEVFDLIVGTLHALNSHPDAGIETVWWFHLHLVSQLGFHPDLTSCHNCKTPLVTAYFSYESGHFYCQNCRAQHLRGILLENIELRLVKYLIAQSLETLDREAIRRSINPPADTGKSPRAVNPTKLTDFLSRYLQYHVEGVTTLRSLEFFTTLTRQEENGG